MTANSRHRHPIHPAFRMALLGSLFVSGALLLVSIQWIYSRIHLSIGTAVAEVSVAVMSILILALVGVGVRVGLQIDRSIRHGAVDECMIYQSSSQVRNLVLWLGYEEIVAQNAICLPADCQESKEILAQIEKPRRRGRSPTHPLDKWTKVVVAWENRDPVRHPMTLSEFLCEQFGEYADGSPRMSENSFYENRKRVIAELRNDIARKQFSES